MARRKARKSAYIPPQSETDRRKQRAPTSSRASGRASTSRAQARVPQPPSWKRTLRQAPIYFVVVAGLNFLLSPHKDSAGHALSQGDRLLLSIYPSIAVVLAFVPFMYFLERNRWRRYEAQQGKGDVGTGRGNRIVSR
jgi:hypothetical protein